MSMNTQITFVIKPFEALSREELYEVLQLRAAVFVVEQNCVYQDIDGKDHKALHVLGFKSNKIVAYARLFDQGLYFDEPSIGRVVVAPLERKFGYGHDLMKASIDAIFKNYGKSTIRIAAQTYLIKFYTQHGFEVHGAPFLEDGIPHVTMYHTQ